MYDFPRYTRIATSRTASIRACIFPSYNTVIAWVKNELHDVSYGSESGILVWEIQLAAVEYTGEEGKIGCDPTIANLLGSVLSLPCIDCIAAILFLGKGNVQSADTLSYPQSDVLII
jgi:hypothetical protein